MYTLQLLKYLDHVTLDKSLSQICCALVIQLPARQGLCLVSATLNSATLQSAPFMNQSHGPWSVCKVTHSHTWTRIAIPEAFSDHSLWLRCIDHTHDLHMPIKVLRGSLLVLAHGVPYDWHALRGSLPNQTFAHMRQHFFCLVLMRSWPSRSGVHRCSV